VDEHSVSQHLVGGLFALGAGACWATASILFGKLGKSVSSLAMNFGKGVIGLACMAVALSFTGLRGTTTEAWIYLSLSGLVGITLGDTVFFDTLRRLGPRRTLLMTTLIPVLVAIMSFAMLGERLGPQAWLGAAVTVAGVTWTMWERLPEGEETGSWRAGVGYGLITVLTCAVAAILSKVGVAGTKPLEATGIRLLAGTGGLLLLGLARGRLIAWVTPFRAPKQLGALAVAAFVGTFVGIWFSMASFAWTSATVATILSATDPIFVLPLAALFMGERLRPRPVLGAFVALLGVSLLLTR
jgi:drug/metabolite transporter (DMT)-like permease